MEALSSIFLLSKCNYTVKGSPQTATKLQCLWSDMTGLDINEDLISLGVDLCWWNFRACRIFRYKSTRYIYRHLNLYLHIYIYIQNACSYTVRYSDKIEFDTASSLQPKVQSFNIRDLPSRTLGQYCIFTSVEVLLWSFSMLPPKVPPNLEHYSDF